MQGAARGQRTFPIEYYEDGRIYKIESLCVSMCVRVCLSVCLSVSLFVVHGNSFEPIRTKYGMRHPHMPQMVTEVSSAVRACGLALSAPELAGATYLHRDIRS